MVPRLCVMTINWVWAVNLWRYPAKRSTLESSSAPLDLVQQTEWRRFQVLDRNNRAMAVKAFSPPDSCIIFCSFLPGGWEIIWIPASRISSPSTSSRLPCPPSEQFPEYLIKPLRISLNFSSKLAAHACIQFFNNI